MSKTADTPVLDAKIEGLREHPDNPRQIREDRMEDLKQNLTEDPEMLRARPLIALPDGTVIAGNQRLRAARELGWETIPTVFVDLDESTAKRWMLRDNNEFGEWDNEAVTAMLDELRDDTDLVLTGFDQKDIDRLLGDLATSPVPPPGNDKYEEQYGVIVICEDEASQEKAFNDLSQQGFNVRVVVT